MKQTLFTVNSEPALDEGFTLLEVLVAVFLSALIGTLVTKALLFNSDTFLKDALRMRIQQNLRGAQDIISMNVRQAGEGLDKLFPAVTLARDSVTGNATLTLRRKTLGEVLVVCRPVTAGATTIYVSDTAATEPSCLPVNLTDSIQSWTDHRAAADDETVRIYMYDRVGKTGEFIEYTGEGTSGGSNYINVDGPLAPYPDRSTSLYVVEDFTFALDATSKTLRLIVDGQVDEPQDVAYNITQFQSSIRMQDGTVVQTLAPADANGWKKIRAVDVTLSGEGAWKSMSSVRSVKGQYFPRNVLSQ